MITINVANFLQSAFSNDQAEMLKGKIEEALKKDPRHSRNPMLTE